MICLKRKPQLWYLHYASSFEHREGSIHVKNFCQFLKKKSSLEAFSVSCKISRAVTRENFPYFCGSRSLLFKSDLFDVSIPSLGAAKIVTKTLQR